MGSDMEDVKRRLLYTIRLLNESKGKLKQCEATNRLRLDVRMLDVSIDIRKMKRLVREMSELYDSCVEIINAGFEKSIMEFPGLLSNYGRFACHFRRFRDIEAKCTETMDGMLEKRKEEPPLSDACKVCLMAVAEMVTKPCHHYVSCGRCAYQLRRCPVCRKHIETRLPISEIDKNTIVYKC